MKISDIIAELEAFAPIELSEVWDSIGLMAGRADAECSGVMLALDLTPDVILQAEKEGCNLIVTHHPFIFRALRSVDFSEAKGAMICGLAKKDMTVYSMHTNLDKAPRGLNYTLAEMFGGNDIKLDGSGVLFDIEPQSLSDFAKRTADLLRDRSVRIVGDPNRLICRVYAVSGSGGSEYERARECADVLLTGDLKHHSYIDAICDGFALCEYSHFSSEIIAQDILANVLDGTEIKCKKAIQNSPFRLLEEI